ncbi:hypothetical protein HMPREF3159_03465 [Brachybacterium sp. HMSC06H03]|uniref:hypothetical protein n=1 Tax=Brachybacterium sp. HMSC06H03 TaxID=1581127 RepID=UPI0008A2F503|nr:hypothetical protein [Brachybacterium sp. HMSC06H03]OFT62583.1 hypothetical protein HMPREF3159_03465 [Brachybacterium sp. HMSC06H03]
MTTLYRPVLIESAEQAEALPFGTVAKRTKWRESGEQDYYSAVRVGYNAWFTTSDTADRQDSLSRHMVGWTALVPIEAVEEREDTSEFDWDGFVVRESTRLVTPWEEV